MKKSQKKKKKKKSNIGGLGDLVKWLANLLGFRTCASCERRRAWLNRLFPFRRLSPQDKIAVAMEKLHGRSIDDDTIAMFHLKYKQDIQNFREAFGQRFENLARDENKRFQILFFDKETLHCALTSTPHMKVRIKREDRKQIEKEIREKTKWKQVRWHA